MNKRRALPLDWWKISAVVADWAPWRTEGLWPWLRLRYAMVITKQRTSFERPANKLSEQSMGGFGSKPRAEHPIGLSTSDFSVSLYGGLRVPVYETDPIDAVAQK